MFYDEKGYALLSQTALYYIGGLLAHSTALLALTSPSTNSYRRLVPGLRGAGQPGVLRRGTGRPRSGSRCTARAPSPRGSSTGPQTATCNPYLAFSAMLMAGLDGIKKKIDPGEPHDMDMFELSKEEAGQDQDGPGQPGEGPGRPRGGPRLPAARAMCSPRTWSRPGSTTRGSRRTTPSGCGRTRRSSSCTTTVRVVAIRNETSSFFIFSFVFLISSKT